MKTHCTITFVLIFALSVVSAVNADEVPKPKSDLGRNAALVYWVAFDQYDSAIKDESLAKAVNDYTKAEVDAKLRATLKESTALSLLRLASRIERCDWGTADMLHEQGPMTLLPHLSRCRQLTRLGLLRARVHLIDKKPAQALEDLMAVHRLARHSQAGDILITMLVGVATEAMANQFVADHLSVIDDATLRSYLDQRAKLPAMMHVRQAIIGERDGFGGWIKREFIKLQDAPAMARLMAALAGDEQGLLLRQIAGKSTEQSIAMADDMIRMYDPLIKAMDLPPDQFSKASEEWSEQIEASKNPLVKLLMPAFATSYYTYHRSLARSAILHAAIIYRLDGKAAFEKIKDPYGDGSFTVANHEEGIVISSKLPDHDKTPVKLNVKWKPQEK